MSVATQPTFLFPLWNHDPIGRGGASGPVCPLGFVTNQNRMAVPTWSYAFEKYPPKRIIEIGAYNGGFTCALAVHAYNIGARVYSFDRQQIPNAKYLELGQFLGIQWYVMDCFSEQAIATIKSLVTCSGVTYLMCDGGDKAKEINTFAPLLKPGDVIGGHDYFIEPRHDWWGWTELTKEKIPLVSESGDFEPFYQEYFDFAAWLVYRKKLCQ